MNQVPSGWIESKLGDFVKLKNGFAFKSKDYIDATENSVPVIRISDIQNGKALTDKASHVDQSKTDERFLINKGDLLIAMSGATTGKTGIYKSDKEAYQNQRVGNLKLVSEDTSCPRYRNYLIKSLQNEILKKAYGAAQPNISAKDLGDIDIMLAPFKEQNRIADKLDSVLGKVETAQVRLDKIPTILKRFRQSVLAAATSGELTKDWREENGIDLSRWKNSNIGELAEVKTGSTPLKSNKEFYLNGTVPWLTSTVTGQNLVTKAEKFVTTKAVEECRLKVFPSGTLLVAMYGEGKTRGQVTELGIEATINQACAAVLVDQSKANNNFIKLSIISNYEKTRLMAEGGAQPNLNLSKVRAISVNLPSDGEQLEIVRIVTELFSNIELVEKQYKEAKLRVEKVTQSILARAFSGKLFSPISNDEREAATVKTQSSQAPNIKSKQKETSQVSKDAQALKIENKFRSQIKIVSEPATEGAEEKISEVFKLLKGNSNGMSAQALFDSLSDNTFSAIDDLFSELKKLIEQKTVMQTGEGDSSTFKVAK